MKVEDVMSKTRVEKTMRGVDKRRNILLSQVKSVIQGYTNALFVFGPPGLGKTHYITQELDGLCGKTWKHHTAYSTPKALMLSIAETPSAIHLFEDCEALYKTATAASILRAACGSPKQKARWVTYETAHETLRVNFTGGLIVVSNEDLARNKGPLSAVASRFRPIKWDLTIEERISSILQISSQPWARGKITLTAKQCQKVAEFLVTEMCGQSTGAPVDLRTFTEHALPAYAHSLANPGVNWEDVVRSKLAGMVEGPQTRGERNGKLEMIAFSIHNEKALNTKQKIAKWKEETGLGQAIFYRHLRKAKPR